MGRNAAADKKKDAAAKPVQATEKTAAPLPDTDDVKVIEDQWYGEISSGDPFYEAARPYIEANPDKHFRWLSDPHCQRRTKRGYQDVYDKQGRIVECAGQRLGWIPRHEYERRQRAQEARTMSVLKTSRETHQEAERKAARDSGGAIEILPDEGERFVGNRRVAL
jgi:hypothetical protein